MLQSLKKLLVSLLPGLVSVIIFLTSFFVQPGIPNKVEIPDTPGQRLLSDMKAGWNLGNTMEAYYSGRTGLDTETMWGNPKTTEAMFLAVKDAGFRTVRIPTTWDGHFQEGSDTQITQEWMDRVQEVVDYAYRNDMYVILNMQHDNQTWLKLDEENFDASMARYVAIWEQIAERFKDYGEHLILESTNEPRVIDSLLEWNGGAPKERERINELNAIFVDTIRKSGGYNAERCLMLPTYAATSLWSAMADMKLPEDDRLIVSIHAYYPYYFAMADDNSWGTALDKYDLEHMLATIYKYFVSKGIPVYMDEFGCVDSNNLEDRVRWTEFYVATAKKYGIPCNWWDNGIFDLDNKSSFGLLDRNTLTWRYPELVDAIMRGVNS